MNILFLSQRIPYPPNKGDKIRSYNILKYLSVKHDIYLGTLLDNENDRVYVDTLKKICKDVCAIHIKKKHRLIKGILSGNPFSVSYFYDQRLQGFVDTVLSDVKIDTVYVYCSSMAEYVFRSPVFEQGNSRKINTVVDFVDLDSEKWRQYAEFSPFPLSLIYRLENKRLFQYEIKINRFFNHSLFTSQREIKLFKQIYPDTRNISVIANGVDCNYFCRREDAVPDITAVRESPTRPTAGSMLVFTGHMEYFANVDAVAWFCREIFPKVREKVPDAEFFIVGGSPTNTVLNLSQIDGVTVTGSVPDIRPYYWWADVCVMPLRIARGIQNKLLEAMSTGNAIVATRNASDGITCENNNNIMLSDSAQDFADAIIHLLQNPEIGQALGQTARDNVIRHYSWTDNLSALDPLLKPRSTKAIPGDTPF